MLRAAQVPNSYRVRSLRAREGTPLGSAGSIRIELNLLVVLAQVEAVEVRSTIDAEQHGFTVDRQGSA